MAAAADIDRAPRNAELMADLLRLVELLRDNPGISGPDPTHATEIRLHCTPETFVAISRRVIEQTPGWPGLVMPPRVTFGGVQHVNLSLSLRFDTLLVHLYSISVPTKRWLQLQTGDQPGLPTAPATDEAVRDEVNDAHAREIDDERREIEAERDAGRRGRTSR